MTARLNALFSKLREEKRPALISFTMAGDPDIETAQAILNALPACGVDIVELGMPFSDPTADGPSIQAAGMRALAHGTRVRDVLDSAAHFRQAHPQTPLILMGYYNPILRYGTEAFSQAAAAAGVDGLIIVDLPPEEEDEMRLPMEQAGLCLIRLIAPTTDDQRLERLLRTASGFVYTIAVKGITGTHAADSEALVHRVAHIKSNTSLPVVAGFGIRTAEQAAALKSATDGIVVGSAIVDIIGRQPHAGDALVEEISPFVRSLRAAIS